MAGIFKINKGTKRLLTAMVIVSLISIFVAYLYYSGLNKMEDPRILEAKEMLLKYDNLMKEAKYSKVLPLLDSAEEIFVKTPGYKESFERGIIYNNKGAVYLSIALTEKDSGAVMKDALNKAENYFKKSAEIYKNWIKEFKDIKKEAVKKKIKKYFPKGSSAFKDHNINDLITKRTDDIMLARIETPRRLSVVYTNLGIIKRHKSDVTNALNYYEKALKLWKENITAKNNLNILLDRPKEDRTILEKLFPKDRKKIN